MTVGHDNKGLAPAWFVENVTVVDEATAKEYPFQVERWLSKDMDDGLVERELYEGASSGDIATYDVTVTTGDVRGAGTDANISMVLVGTDGSSGTQKLESGGDDFERGQEDAFFFECLDVGPSNNDPPS